MSVILLNVRSPLVWKQHTQPQITLIHFPLSNPGSEEVLPNTSNMDISTGHLVLAYMEDHLKNKQRLEQEWVALCGYEADPCATTNAFKAENKKKNRDGIHQYFYNFSIFFLSFF
jgi:hypothetical protein